jgi:hypothetical protein
MLSTSRQVSSTGIGTSVFWFLFATAFETTLDMLCSWRAQQPASQQPACPSARTGSEPRRLQARNTLHYPLNNAEFFPPGTGSEPRRLQARNTLHYPLNNGGRQPV